MPKQFMLIVVAAVIGAVIAFSVDDGPPFSEGPEAERHNHEVVDPPHGPWQWEGGD